MNMRLMPKSKISQANAQAKKQDIDEGVKLATRIDGLRKTLADEEVSLEKFRVSTIANIKAETTPLKKYLGGLKKEVEELTRNRVQLLIPLDAEWERVKTEKVTIKQRKNDIEQVQKTTEKDQVETREELRGAKEAKIQAVFCEEEATKVLNSATIERREAKEISEQADTTRREADIYKQEALANVAEEKRKLKLREDSLVKKEEQNDKDREDIASTKLQLADERATLERALKA